MKILLAFFLLISVLLFGGCGTSVDVNQISLIPENVPIKIHGTVLHKKDNDDIVMRAIYTDEEGNPVFPPEIVKFLEEIYYINPDAIFCATQDLRDPEELDLVECDLEEMVNEVVLVIKKEDWQYLVEVMGSLPRE